MSPGFPYRYVAIALCLGAALSVLGKDQLVLGKLPVSVVRPGDSLSVSFTLAGTANSSNAVTVDFFLGAAGSSEKNLLLSQRVQGPGVYKAVLKLVPICGNSVTNWRIEASERSQPALVSAYSEPFAFSAEPAKLYFVPVNGTNQIALTWKTNGAPYT